MLDVEFPSFVVTGQEGDKSLTNFQCPACAKGKGGQYMYGTVDVEALRERGVTAAAVVEPATQGEEEAGGSELVSNTCTWPPSEAEYFFGE